MAEHGHQVTTHAYVLINTEPTRTAAVIERLKVIPRSRVREVLGPYDLIVELEEDVGTPRGSTRCCFIPEPPLNAPLHAASVRRPRDRIVIFSILGDGPRITMLPGIVPHPVRPPGAGSLAPAGEEFLFYTMS